MRRVSRVLLSLAAGAAAAQTVAQTSTAPAEPAVQRTVIEDDGARIEELRVRGQLQRVVVRHKMPGARPYEILVGDGARDQTPERRSAGQRVWHVLSF